MKNTLYIIKSTLLALAVALSATSCLNKYPGSAILEEEAMQSFSDAEQHLIGIYSSLLSSSLHSGYLTLLPDIQADLVYAVEGFSNTYGNFWQWNIRSTDTEIEAIYGSLYSVIGNCNFFLDRIDPIIGKQVDDDRIAYLEDAKGQVYAIRALCYLELAKIYCKAYDPATAKDELGMMLRTRYFEEEPAIRSSLYDTYALICSDLEKAEELIDGEDVNNTANSSFITKLAAHAIHARAALYMQDWDKAIEQSSILIDENDHLLQLASTTHAAASGYSEYTHMWAYDESPEVIWRIQFTTTAYGGRLGQVFLNYNNDFTYYYPDYVPAQSAIDLFSSGDLRANDLFASGLSIGRPSGMNWPLIIKYYGNLSLMNVSATSFMHVSMPKPLRLAEQYLIRAEAYCEKGDFSKATADISTLRSKRFQTGGAISLNSSNWQAQISDERVRELYMEGFRLHDLKRWGKGFKRVKQSNSLEEGSTLDIKADNPLFVWPIPQHELDVPGSGILPNESNK